MTQQTWQAFVTCWRTMLLDPSSQTDAAERFVLETDQAPEFWQFLNGLRGDDLLVELIVNDLDARATRTEIRFETDRLVCVGNGEPIDAEGWSRLRLIKGAGHTVAAKVGLFGVKNHGLKACFTLGNEITVRSAGLQILQTLFADGPNKPPFPGVRIPPRSDPNAPGNGTQIEVTYRRERFSVPHGEALNFDAVSEEQIANVFRDAVASLPRRLLGIMRPGVLDRYTLVISHHLLGSHTFEFSAGRVRRQAGLITFFRECHQCAAEGNQLLAREHACLAVSSQRSETRPDFFQSSAYRIAGKQLFKQKGLIIEVAWEVDSTGRISPTEGRLRYPVAYPGNDAQSRSTAGVHYSGPFISDTERHELAAQSSSWNGAIIKSCDELLSEVLINILLPRHGAAALSLAATLEQDRLKSFAARLQKARAFPAVTIKGTACRQQRGDMLVIPVYAESETEWSPTLAKVAPATLPIIDPKTPKAFVELLASGECDGWNDDHLRFDAQDVLNRLEEVEAEYFAWRSEGEWRRTLSHPEFAKNSLDALHPFLNAQPPNERQDGAAANFPDSEGRLQPLKRLKRGAAIPTELLELEVPPVIHPAIRAHPVFKLEGWRLDGYALRDLLRDGDLDQKPAAVRRRFFTWLAANGHELGRDDWPAVKALRIWPAVDGTLRRFDELCLPESKLASLLGDHIAKPTREVRSFCNKPKGKRVRLVLRAEPTPDEVYRFYSANVAEFPQDRTLDAGERSKFHEFERTLASLSSSKRSARALRSLRSEAVALNREGFVRPEGSLVREAESVSLLKLHPKDLIDRPATDLDSLLPPARKPSARMALDALRADPANEKALLPRLAVATALSDLSLQEELSKLPCLPYHGQLAAPERLAFKGNLGEFWGGWKLLIGGEGLSDHAQDLYRAAGVIRSFPTPQTSRAYFEWLNGQPPATIAAQLGCVIRHILHRNGVGAWLFEPPELECMPVEDGSSVQLLTISQARKIAVVDDVAEIAEAIRIGSPDPKLRLAIHSVRVPNQPIADELKRWGLPPLSSLAKGPLSPHGNNVVDAPSSYLRAIHDLAGSAAGKRFRKQLQEFDVSQNLIEPQFQRRLLAIKRVVIASGLTVQFRVRNRLYRASREWAVLPSEIWLDRSGDQDDLLMKAVADIVFVKPRPRYLSAVLKDALSQRTRDFRPAAQDDAPDDEETVEDDQPTDEGTGESTQHHPGSAPDPKRNRPKPGAIFSGAVTKGQSKRSGSNRRQVPAEDIQRRQLKIDHYASHCQIELARRALEELAPAGSYAEFAENRIRMLEAHHPDKTSADGSRHAGNLLILTKVNHDAIGTRLSRDDLTLALRKRWKPHTIKKADGTAWLEGGIADAVDKLTGEVISFFFTNEHRDYWLKMAGQ